MKNSKLHALASALAAYLLDQTDGAVRGVYLFGSVARNEATAESDIDVFVDTLKEAGGIKAIIERFESTSTAKAFRATRIRNPIRALVGNLYSDEFKELRLVIAAEGITLYGKGISTEKGKQPYLLIWFAAPAAQPRKVAFLRRIYGRTEKGVLYPGLVQKLGGLKIGAGVVLIPIRFKLTFLAELKKAKVRYSIRNVWL